VRLLVVCLGNICRSPLAEGALRSRIQSSQIAGEVEVDSAGTGDWHVGQPPDQRAIECAKRHGVDISMLRGRQVRASDFEDFDWVLCADAENLRNVRDLAPPHARHKVALLMEWARVEGSSSIPDPYTGGNEHFEEAWRLVDAAAQGAVTRLCGGRESGIIRGE
jgi:protein-tyrosine phosphatase